MVTKMAMRLLPRGKTTNCIGLRSWTMYVTKDKPTVNSSGCWLS